MNKFERLPNVFDGRIYGKQKWDITDNGAVLTLYSPWNCLNNCEFRLIADFALISGLFVAIIAEKDCLIVSFS